MTHSSHSNALFLSLSLALACFVGCEHGSESDSFSWGNSSVPAEKKSDSNANNSSSTSTANNSSFVGKWHLIPDGGGTGWYGFFNADGTWRICDNADGSRQRVHGKYSVSGGKLKGDMTNPGVGTGAIEATISGGGIMAFKFIEYWHDPHKTVLYSGSKL